MEKRKEDYALIQEVLAGSDDAFAELLARYKNLVYSVIMRMVNDPEEANDLAQEVFIKVYKNLDKYQPTYKFSTWLIRIATNHVIDYRRKRKQETVNIEDVHLEASGSDTPEAAYLRKEGRLDITAALSALPEMYRIPIVLYHQQGLSYQEIADILSEPLSKVKNRIFRGRRMLKAILTGKEEGEGYAE